MQLSFLALTPTVSEKDGTLVAETSPAGRIVALGALHRRVEIDPQREEIRITTRSFWCRQKSRTVPFASIRRVRYTYRDLRLFRSREVHDPIDCFKIGLDLKGGESVHLFRFIDDGVATNETRLPDIFYRRQLRTDLSGNQETASRQFATALEQITGAPLVV